MNHSDIGLRYVYTEIPQLTSMCQYMYKANYLHLAYYPASFLDRVYGVCYSATLSVAGSRSLQDGERCRLMLLIAIKKCSVV